MELEQQAPTKEQFIEQFDTTFAQSPETAEDKCGYIRGNEDYFQGDDGVYAAVLSHYQCPTDGSAPATGMNSPMSLFDTFTIIAVILVVMNVGKLVSISMIFTACSNSDTTSRRYLIGMVCSICAVGGLKALGNDLLMIIGVVVLSVFMTIVHIYNYTTGCAEFKVDTGEDKDTANAEMAFKAVVALDMVTYIGCGIFYYMRMSK